MFFCICRYTCCCGAQYYYYYRFMNKRINELHPQLPRAVVDKLLTYDAEELDTLLKYPSAARAQVIVIS